MKKLLRRIFTTECHECGEVRVWFWQRRCDFCDKDEGRVK